MKTIGDRISAFENSDIQTISTFNRIFPDCQLTEFDKWCSIEIGEITKNETTRLLTIAGNIKIEWDLTQKLKSEIKDEKISNVSINNDRSEFIWMHIY